MNLKITNVLQYIKSNIKKVLVPISLLCFLYISNSFNIFAANYATQTLYYIILISVIAGFGVFSYKNSEKPSLLWSAMVINGIVYMIAYSTWRSIIGTHQIGEYFIGKYSLSSNDWRLFKTVFSIGYGFFQFFSGYVIGKFGNKAIGLFGIISAICIFLTNSTYISSVELLMFIRFINGIVVSCGALCISYQLRILKVSPDKYSTIFSASNTFASAMNAVVMNQFSRYLNPNTALNIISFLFLIPSCIFFVNGFIAKQAEEKKEISGEQISYKTVITTAICNRKYNLMLFQSILIVIAGWTLRDNFLFQISEICYSVDPLYAQNQMKYLIEIGFIFGFLFILHYLKGGNYKKMMTSFSIMNLMSSLVLLINNYISVNVYMVYLSVFMIGVSVKGHLLPQIMAGSSEKNTQLSSGLIGFLNAGVMLFALPFCQQIMPSLSLLASTMIFVIIAIICLFISLVDGKDHIVIEEKDLVIDSE